MFMRRTAAATLLIFAMFHLALGLNSGEWPWGVAAALLVVAAGGLLVARAWARIAVFGSAACAAALGAFSQIRVATATDASLEAAVVTWALWTSCWIAVAYIGSRYLPRGGGAPVS